jgi:hypothetical protein
MILAPISNSTIGQRVKFCRIAGAITVLHWSCKDGKFMPILHPFGVNRLLSDRQEEALKQPVEHAFDLI